MDSNQAFISLISTRKDYLKFNNNFKIVHKCYVKIGTDVDPCLMKIFDLALQSKPV